MAGNTPVYAEDAKDIETRLVHLKEEVVIIKGNFENLEESYIELLKSNYNMVTDFKVEQGKMAIRVSVIVFFATTIIGFIIEQIVTRYMS